MTVRAHLLKLVERFAWIVGVALVAIWVFATFFRALDSRQQIDRFMAVRAADASSTSEPDLSLWSPERIRAWRDTLKRPAPEALAVLRIPRLGLEVPILEGTDDWTLNRAVGHIADTAAPGTDGNSGIAGHRDGFFRGLKDVKEGDEIALETHHGRETYRIERIWIVDPTDVSVLDPTPSRAITLVTCYPFYFIGSAPQRFIVRAVVKDLSPGTRTTTPTVQ
jgi:sortase A